MTAKKPPSAPYRTRPSDMWEQIHANKIRSMLVVTVLAVLLIVIGGSVGVVLGGPNAGMVGAVIAFGLWFVLWMTTMSSGDQVLLSMARAREPC